MAKVMVEARGCGLPVVACLLGRSVPYVSEGNIKVVNSLEEAAYAALNREVPQDATTEELNSKCEKLSKDRCYLRAIYSGGTLCYESLLIFDDHLKVHSNIALDKNLKLAYPAKGGAHYSIDLGEDEFTDGRPHPMIDSTLRQERVVEAISSPDTRVLLLDVVIGYGANADPAKDLVSAIQEGRAMTADGGPLVIAHVCGTEGDPQSLRAQEEQLKAAGILTFSTNAAAVRAAMSAITGRL
jgi:FdrA protein